jgi:hypothetical protein
MHNLSRVITSSRLNSQTITVERSSGSFDIDGVWVENTPETITMSAIVTVMNERELAQMPEGDRVKSAMKFATTDPVYTTRVGNAPGTSDKVYWKGDWYKIFQVGQWVDYGFYTSAGERIAGA